MISERKFPDWPITYEKFQIYELGQKHENDINIYIDSDALIHPETPDWSIFIPKDTVAMTGADFAPLRWKYDRFYLRDGRNLGACFPGGTIVNGNGPIEKLFLGSNVIGRTGLQTVRNTYQRTFTGNLISIKTACLPEIQMTPEHPILVSKARRKYITGRKHPIRTFTEPTWKDAQDITTDDWVIVPRFKGNEYGRVIFKTQRNKKRKVIDIPLDDDIAWLLGIYVAEGYLSENNRLNLAIGSKEQELADEIIRILKKIGVNPHLNTSHNRTSRGSMVVVVSSAWLARLFDEWCGHGASNKRVPIVIMKSPEHIVRSFLKGLIDGDGCLFKKWCGVKGFRLVTISRNLVFDTVQLLHSIGVHAHAGNPRKNQDVIQGRKVNSHQVYEVNWSLNSWLGLRDRQGALPKGHAHFTEDVVFLPVRRISKKHVKDLPVYNIETDDHTYGVPFIVHNCHWQAWASDWCIDMWEPPTDITPEEAIASCFPTMGEERSGIVTPYHLIDDFLVGRNIAKYGLKYLKINELAEQKCPGSWFFWHQYTIPPEAKVLEMKKILDQWGLL